MVDVHEIGERAFRALMERARAAETPEEIAALLPDIQRAYDAELKAIDRRHVVRMETLRQEQITCATRMAIHYAELYQENPIKNHAHGMMTHLLSAKKHMEASYK